MKKLLQILCIAFLAVGCASQETTAKEFDSKKVEELSETYVEDLRNGNFQNITDHSNETIKTQLTASALETGWKSIVFDSDVYEKITDTRINPGTDSAQTQLTLQYDTKQVYVFFQFDENYEITALYIDYQLRNDDSLVENDAFKEIPITIGEGEYQVDGVLTLPVGDFKTIVILVQGSGQTDMNETIGQAGNQPFKDLAHGLGNANVASIRFHKRYHQHANTISSLMDMTIETEVLEDVSSAITFANTDERVEGADVVVLGHSLGGMLAPTIATRHESVKAIIAMAGTPNTLQDVIKRQVLEQPQSEEQIAEINKSYEAINNLTDESTNATLLGFSTNYWKSLQAVNTKEDVASLSIPILIMQGDKDPQVSMEEDYQAWHEVLGERENVTYKVYQNLDHLFMESETTSITYQLTTKRHVREDVIADIVTWLSTI